MVQGKHTVGLADAGLRQHFTLCVHKTNISLLDAAVSLSIVLKGHAVKRKIESRVSSGVPVSPTKQGRSCHQEEQRNPSQFRWHGVSRLLTESWLPWSRHNRLDEAPELLLMLGTRWRPLGLGATPALLTAGGIG